MKTIVYSASREEEMVVTGMADNQTVRFDLHGSDGIVDVPRDAAESLIKEITAWLEDTAPSTQGA